MLMLSSTPILISKKENNIWFKSNTLQDSPFYMSMVDKSKSKLTEVT